MATVQQAQQYLQQVQAKYVTVKSGVQWWKLPDGSWIGVRTVSPGWVELRRAAAGACGCGG